MNDAKSISQAGALTVIEAIPEEVASDIIKKFKHWNRRRRNCDGQILVSHDILNLYGHLHQNL